MIAGNYPKVYLYRRIVQAKLFIDANYSENIDLDNIADEACFSKFHFIRRFKSIYGKTPHQYLMAVRIDKAMELLKANETVSDACMSVGFESLSSFTHLFKRLVGKTPSQYLLLQQEMKQQIFEKPPNFIPGCFAEKKGWKQNSNSQQVNE